MQYQGSPICVTLPIKSTEKLMCSGSSLTALFKFKEEQLDFIKFCLAFSEYVGTIKWEMPSTE